MDQHVEWHWPARLLNSTSAGRNPHVMVLKPTGPFSQQPLATVIFTFALKLTSCRSRTIKQLSRLKHVSKADRDVQSILDTLHNNNLSFIIHLRINYLHSLHHSAMMAQNVKFPFWSLTTSPKIAFYQPQPHAVAQVLQLHSLILVL